MKLKGAIWLISILILGFLAVQNEFVTIIAGYGTAFAMSFFLISNSDYEIRDLIVLGLLARIILFMSSPQLSDDIYRFIWDGRMILEGLNPYSWTPTMVASTIDDGSLYDNLNSPDYYSVYPAICQVVFLIATWLAGSSVFWSGFIIKIFLLLADLCIFKFLINWLKSEGQDSRRALWYFLNPLVLIETFGNLHFEVIMMALMMYAFMMMKRQSFSALALAGGVATKLLPAMTLPFILFRVSWQSALKYLFIFCGASLIFFTPILLAFQSQGFGQSVNLYFQTFEFNASIYYILREMGWLVLGYNGIHIIGPLCVITAGLIILIVSYLFRKADISKWPEALLLIFTIYFLFATTVHPWYIITPLVLSLMTKYNYAIVWSAMVTLSYHAYWFQPVKENMYLIAFEYLVVAVFFLYEFNKVRTA